MSKINEILLKLEGYQYATSHDLNMEYYHNQLSEDTSNLCTIILPWMKYCYKHLPMDISNSQDIFGYKMNDLFHGFEFIHAYIYDLLILTKVGRTCRSQKLELTLNKVKGKGPKYRIESSFFGKTKSNI